MSLSFLTSLHSARKDKCPEVQHEKLRPASAIKGHGKLIPVTKQGKLFSYEKMFIYLPIEKYSQMKTNHENI